MRILSLLLIFLACLVQVNPGLAQQVRPSERVVTALNVRAEASSASALVAQLRPGDSAALIRRVPRWYEVRLSDGREGYVSKAWSTVETALAVKAPDELRIHFLAVGAGSCVVIECPGEDAGPLVVDCGTVGRGEGGLTEDQIKAYVDPILTSQATPARIVLTHPHMDHYSYIPELFSSQSASIVWMGGEVAGYSSQSFVEWLEGFDGSVTEIMSGWTSGWNNEGQPVEKLSCGQADTFVLNVNTGDSPNTNSLSLLVEYLDFSAVLTGDSEGVSEDQIVRNFPEGIKADVLLSAHHGSASGGSNSESFANYLSPDAVVYSSGDRFSHPHCEATNRYTNYLEPAPEHDFRCGEGGSYVTDRSSLSEYLTAINGTVVVTTDGKSHVDVHCSKTNDCDFRNQF